MLNKLWKTRIDESIYLYTVERSVIKNVSSRSIIDAIRKIIQ